jgi:hypothetical protein
LLPRGPAFVELTKFDLNLPVLDIIIASTPQDEVNFVHVQKPAVGMPAMRVELKFSERLAQNFLVARFSPVGWRWSLSYI